MLYSARMQRFEVQFSDHLSAEVARLASADQIPEHQVVRQAVALLSYLGNTEATGGEVVIARPDGTETQIVGLGGRQLEDRVTSPFLGAEVISLE